MVEIVPVGEKGRPCGESHGRARWKDATVEHWRDMVESGSMRASEICKQFGVPKQTLSDMLQYKIRAVTPTAWRPRKTTRREER